MSWHSAATCSELRANSGCAKSEKRCTSHGVICIGGACFAGTSATLALPDGAAFPRRRPLRCGGGGGVFVGVTTSAPASAPAPADGGNSECSAAEVAKNVSTSMRCRFTARNDRASSRRCTTSGGAVGAGTLATAARGRKGAGELSCTALLLPTSGRSLKADTGKCVPARLDNSCVGKRACARASYVCRC